MLSTTPADKWVRFEGLNLATGSSVTVDLYKCSFQPTKDLGLITDKFGELALEAKVLIDATKDANGEIGQFGNIALIS
jgi:hypothetical protein